MASTSTSSVQRSFMYDVFMSFRGEDVRKSFVDHLYKALNDNGVIIYKDDKSIVKGEDISDQLITAIKDSKLHIIVFSKNYANSAWCLQELMQIMECQKTNEQTAYPVFYDVEPTQVRNQSGPVGKAFAKHVKKVSAGGWRDALREASNLAGWELKNTGDGHEVQFIYKIVEDISRNPHFTNFSIDANLVGMPIRIEKLLSSLQVDSNDVRMIGIKGIGGGGKTTLARAVFDHISSRFEGKSFVEKVRERSKGSRLPELQKQILTSVFNDQSIVVLGVSDGVHMMKKRMPSRKVLVVLDDVDNVEQLEVLAGELTWFKPGSRIIITTRDEQVLVAHRVHIDNMHDVNLLSDEEAICLLSRYAFTTKVPIQGYEGMSIKVVSYASGLPITIKLLGSFLYGRPQGEWEDTIERLKTIPWKDTLKILEISYDGMEKDHKEIFLYVACLLKGEKEKKAIQILESCGFHAQIGLRVLEQKSLMTIRVVAKSYFNFYGSVNHVYKELVLHDHIEEMGINIVRRLHPDEPNRHKLLWIKDEIEDILVSESGTGAVRSIQLRDTDLHPAKILQGLRKMTNLRFLYITTGGAAYKIDEAGGYLPNTLQYLNWNCYSFRYLPKTFQADNLVHLEILKSNIHQLWEGGERKVLPKLRFLNLSESKLKTFDLQMTPNLEKLILEDCYNLVELKTNDECLHLKEVNLKCCRRLKQLNISDKCPHLTELDLEGCWAFIDLQMHVEFSKLKLLDFSHSGLSNLNLGLTPNLEYLDLSNCKYFVELHMPVECLKLRVLILGGFKVSYFKPGLSPILEKLVSLEALSLSLHDIERLPDSICTLKHLKKLNLSSCWGLKQLPEDLDRLECLEVLNLLNCSSLRDIPNSICKMKCLKELCLTRCKGLKKLPDEFVCLESLEVLRVAGAGIENLSQSISQLKTLKVIDMF